MPYEHELSSFPSQGPDFLAATSLEYLASAEVHFLNLLRSEFASSVELKKLGDTPAIAGEKPIAMVHARTEDTAERISSDIQKSYSLSDKPQKPPKLIQKLMVD